MSWNVRNFLSLRVERRLHALNVIARRCRIYMMMSTIKTEEKGDKNTHKRVEKTLNRDIFKIIPASSLIQWSKHDEESLSVRWSNKIQVLRSSKEKNEKTLNDDKFRLLLIFLTTAGRCRPDHEKYTREEKKRRRCDTPLQANYEISSIKRRFRHGIVDQVQTYRIEPSTT